MPKIQKLLVANRGEIACRVQRTAQRMGIRTVAIYSEADRYAPHVEMADERYFLGGNLPAESYLNIPKILEAARATGADAVHPGYGFLSENPAFARAVREAGLCFVGPTPEAMEKLGNKVTAKQIAREVAVPLVPGTAHAVREGEALVEAKRIGFPLLIKAAAGGGGKGMRKVFSEADLQEAMARARSEALAAFGDDSVFLERYIDKPRHIEIQVFSDLHGNAVYLYERECSIQRRHQKVIEEAPAPHLKEETRKAMGEAALRLIRAAGYTQAGTVEFIVDAEENFYFLEVNTRLQVEHPVTEAITGVDLVEWQLRVAQGERLPLSQEEISCRGHAIEARVYAEDPRAGFLPSTGVLYSYELPRLEGVRIDNGYEEGQLVPLFYDPMLAKVIAWGPDRISAIQRLDQALANFAVVGVQTTIDFVRFVLAHPVFQAGLTHTHFVEEHFRPELLDNRPLSPEEREALQALIDWIAHSWYGSWQNGRE
ncbi:MAG: acetyl-CoA carboxylase biotin carboxylase subunit [Bacteroidia bacterium]|nr:acetyl-CoA carboxylase biotin carboxylase subunit [Bacteroidia bacterium]